MKKTLCLTGSALLAIALSPLGSAPVFGKVAAVAQQKPPAITGAMVPQPTPDADALAAEMRVLADDPKNMDALLGAGELTLKLGDPTAASVLFARAEAVNPNSGRLKADEAAGLVHMERPGEALRLFDQAERLGYDPAKFAGERGLAYDLLGQQERAQRDYRLALKADPDDPETLRRYALSLGISGDKKRALDELDPLVRRSDHAGWRDRAFILAMDGDIDQAKQIASGMLPATMASGLTPFFERLPQLSAADRAFAVHFGEVSATPARLADARLAPPLAPLAPEAQPTQVAAAEPAPKPAKKQRQRRGKTPPPQQVASLTPAPVQQSAAPGFSQSVTTGAVRAVEPAATQPLASVPRQAPRQTVAAASTAPPDVATPVSSRTQVAAATPIPVHPQPIASTATNATPPAEANTRVTAAPAAPTRAEIVASSPAVPSVSASAPVAASNAATVMPQSTPPPRAVAAAPATAPRREIASERPSAVGAEDRILKNIISGITVPASELGVRPMPGATPAAAAEPVETVAVTPDPAAAAKRLEAANAAAVKKAEDARAAAAAKAKVDHDAAVAKKAAAAKQAADDAAAAKKKAADDAVAAKKKAAADAAAAAAKKAKANPSRIWVQVAGGANEGDLPKAWAAVKAKAPDAFKGKSGWSTPLNATNRVLAGPFKTDDAAQDFVNDLKKKGLSAFPFTSDAGQAIDKLPSK